jgi:hypothetical protein
VPAAERWTAKADGARGARGLAGYDRLPTLQKFMVVTDSDRARASTDKMTMEAMPLVGDTLLHWVPDPTRCSGRGN